MGTWAILRIRGTENQDEIAQLPGHFEDSTVEEILRRLLCSTLTEEEIVEASKALRRDRSLGLLARIGKQSPIQLGHGETSFIAVYKA